MSRSDQAKSLHAAARGGIILSLILALFTFALGGGIGVLLGISWGWSEAQRSVHERMSAQTEALRNQNIGLLEEQAELSRRARVDRDALEELKGSLRQLNAEQAELEEELIFYRGLVSPEEGERQMRIRELQLIPTGGIGRYRYSLVLTQGGPDLEPVNGVLALQLLGERKGQQVELPAAEWLLNPDRLRFSFKYFQRLEGIAKVPAGVIPVEIRVQAVPAIKRSKVVDRLFGWHDVISGES